MKEIIIEAPLNSVYEAYADIKGWRRVMGDILSVDVKYDDGMHQEFDMTVQRGSGQETVHSVRFCYPCQAIEMFQTQPPPLFDSMSGVWNFIPCSGGILVQATRKFKIKKDVNFDGSILESFLEKNLSSFKAWIENCA